MIHKVMDYSFSRLRKIGSLLVYDRFRSLLLPTGPQSVPDARIRICYEIRYTFRPVLLAGGPIGGRQLVILATSKGVTVYRDESSGVPT